MRFFYWLMLFLSSLGLSKETFGQDSFLEPADSFHRERFWVATGTASVIYGGVSVALYNTWYKDYPRTSLHSFDDRGEWLDMDKAGHALTTYTESKLMYYGARWTGLNNAKSAWAGAGAGMLFQTTVELMDGMSSRWGFSWADMAMNTAGAGLFLSQQLLWEEQRIMLKISQQFPHYATDPIINATGGRTTQLAWAQDLYGKGIAERFLKDYNGMTIWLSVNPHSFLPDQNNFPAWLNIAGGFGADKVFGAYYNSWRDDSGQGFSQGGPRARQWYLSLDIDWTRMNIRQRWLRYILGVINIIKVPAPAIELRSGRIYGHLIYW